MTELQEAVDMRTTKDTTELLERMCKAQAAMLKVGKSGFNSYDKYKYSTLEDYINATAKALAENGLVLVASVDDLQHDTRTTKNGGTEQVARVKMTFSVFYGTASIHATSWGEGQDRSDKAIYKAITGCRKYGLASLFNLATTEDPEAVSDGRHEPAPKAKAPVSRPAETDGRTLVQRITDGIEGIDTADRADAALAFIEDQNAGKSLTEPAAKKLVKLLVDRVFMLIAETKEPFAWQGWIDGITVDGKPVTALMTGPQVKMLADALKAVPEPT